MRLISQPNFFSFKQTISPQMSSKGKGIMKKNSFIFSFVLLISCDMMAQKQRPHYRKRSIS